MTLPTRALVRRPPQSYRRYYADQGIAIDLPRALTQHAAYVHALRTAGLAVSYVPAMELFPDGVFIEDTGVVWEGQMLVGRMVTRREGEQAAVRELLQATHEIVAMPYGARLDGGDVLHTDMATYVGLSSRTNHDGIEALRDFLAPHGRPVVAVPVAHCLHLKTAATWLGNGTLLAAAELIDVAAFAVERILPTPPGEAHAANTLRIADTLLCRSSFPATGELLEEFAAEHGLSLTRLDLTEFEKGDGSLTCLSIIY